MQKNLMTAEKRAAKQELYYSAEKRMTEDKDKESVPRFAESGYLYGIGGV